MNTTELSPCPFCGGTASLARCGFGTGRVTCSDCGSEGQYRQTHDEAISAWNTRASPAPGRAPLTEWQIDGLKKGPSQSYRDFARAVEAAHGIAPAGGIGGE